MISSSDDRRADRQADIEHRQTAGDEQHAQDLLRGVGHGGERVGGEHGQRFDLGQPLVRGRGGRERRADQHALDLA